LCKAWHKQSCQLQARGKGKAAVLPLLTLPIR
jgi:hypothetical protein